MTTPPVAPTQAPVSADGRPASTHPGAPLQRAGRRPAVVTTAASVNQAVTSVPGQHGSSAIFAAVEGEFGWSRDLVAGVASFGRVGGTLLGPLEGWLTDRFGAPLMLLLGMLLGGAALIVFSRIETPVSYYAAYFVMSLGFSIGGFTPAMSAVNSWVSSQRRATAMAFVFAGQSVAAFLVPLMALGFTVFGWRATLVVVGLIIMLCALPVSLAIRGRPPKDASARAPAYAAGDFTVREAVRTRAFWAIATSHMLVNLSNAAVSAHLVLHLKDEGMSLSQASSVLPVMGATAFAAHFLGGYMGDRMDKRIPAFGAMLLQASAVALLPFAHTYALAMLFGAMWGMGVGVRFPVLHAMRGDYFGRRKYGTILGLSSLPLAIGMTVTPWLVGRIYVAQDTYMWTFLALAAFCLAGSFVVLLARRPERPSLRTPN